MAGLTGFGRPQGGRRGGVRRLWLVPADGVMAVDMSADGTGCTGISLREGTRWAEYQFREGDAAYEERTVLAGTIPGIIHEISFALPRLDYVSSCAVTELLSGNAGGFVGLLVTGGGDAIVLGWSEKFGFERPLRMGAAVSSTGKSTADTALRRVVLKNEDTSPAIVYTGSLPSES